MASVDSKLPLLKFDENTTAEENDNAVDQTGEVGSASKNVFSDNAHATNASEDVIKDDQHKDGAGSVNDGKFSLRRFISGLRWWHVVIGIIVLIVLIIGLGVGIYHVVTRSEAHTEGGNQATNQCDGKCEITLPANGSIFRVSAPNATVACFAGKAVPMNEWMGMSFYVRPGNVSLTMAVTLGANPDQPCSDVTWRSEDEQDSVAILRPGPTQCQEVVQSGKELCSVPWRWSCPRADNATDRVGFAVWVDLESNVKEYVQFHGAPDEWQFYREVADAASDGHMYVNVPIFILFQPNATDMDEATQMRTVLTGHAIYDGHDAEKQFRRFESSVEPRYGCYGDPERDVY